MIAPNTPPTTPAVFGWLWWLQLILNFSTHHITGAVMMLPYIPSSDPFIGMDPVLLMRDFASAFTPAFGPCFTTGTDMFQQGFYWGTALGIQRVAVGPGLTNPQGTVAGEAFPTSVNALIRKRTNRYPTGRPRLWMPFVPLSHSSDRVSLNSTGIAAYDAFALQVAADVHSQGITFTPASWTSKTNLFEPLQDAFVVSKMARVMRRAPHRSKPNTIKIDSYIWMY